MKKKKNASIFLIISLLILSFIPVDGAKYHVAPWGKDGNPGTELKPWQTIQKACDMAVAGDTVVIRDGVYPVTREIRPRNSGTPGAWITYLVLPGEKAVIDAENFVSADTLGTYPSRLGLGTFHLEKVSYTRVIGLTVRNSRSAGFIVRGPATSVHLLHCVTDRSYNSGIGIWYADSVKVMHCKVTRADEPEMRVPGQRMGREAPHEAISICGARFFEVAYNHVHMCFKEGIDVKEVSAHGVVHHNHVHDLPRQGLYVDSWFGLLEDVTFHSNIVHDCEWGFAISAEGKDSELKNIRFHNNLIFNNRASGIIFGIWGDDRPRSGIEIFNNTIYNNGTPGHWAGTTGGIDFRSTNLNHVKIYRNIIMDNWGFEIGIALEPEAMATWTTNNAIVIEDNITGPFRDKLSSRSFFEVHSRGFKPVSNREANPQFTNISRYDFSLRKGSPALKVPEKKGETTRLPYYGALGKGEKSWLKLFQ